jgi:hypothetical protein
MTDLERKKMEEIIKANFKYFTEKSNFNEI